MTFLSESRSDYDPIFIYDAPVNDLSPGKHSVNWMMKKNGVFYQDYWVASDLIKARLFADFQIAAVLKIITEQYKKTSHFTTRPA